MLHVAFFLQFTRVKMLTIDSPTEFFFDRSVNRYRYTDSKKFAPKKAILNLTKEYMKKEELAMQALASRYFTGEISVLEFQLETAKHLKHLHISALILGKDGVENVTSNDFLAVGRILKQQYYDGKGTNGKRFGLKYLVRDLLDGKLSEAQLKSRLAAYAKSAKQSFWVGRKQASVDDNKTFAIRKLGAVDRHCLSCLRYSALPPQPINQIILPGQACECGSNCACTLQFMTLEQAVQAGLEAE